jgi:hypothetical protein
MLLPGIQSRSSSPQPSDSDISVPVRINHKIQNLNLLAVIKSRDSSVGIALGYGLEDRGSRVRFPVGAGNFSLQHRVQNGSGDHPASYPMGTGGKAAEA